MTKLEYDLILRFLISRTIGTIVITIGLIGCLVFLGFILRGTETNDALTTILGGIITVLGFALKELSGAMSRDITEFLERTKKKKELVEPEGS